jgi:hypothetical protein
MEKALVIFNGIKFPHHLAERAIEWTAANQAELLALFLHASEEPEEGYIFPSDLDLAEKATNKKDAKEADLRIIRDQIKLLENMAKVKGVSIRADVLTNPPMEEILNISNRSVRSFIDKNYDPNGIFASPNFDVDTLVSQSTSYVESV